jgi:ubiquinone/menaquinone biosynthesis C-methylase UbiE
MANYNEWHRSHDGDDDTSAPWHRFVKDSLTRNDVDDRVILEIGCGRGGFSNYLAHLDPRPRKVVASDYSSTALEIAKAKYSNNDHLIDWKQQDIMALDFKENYFDTVISCETIEHVTNPQFALRELYRVLKPGGRLFLTCPNYFNPFGVWCVYRWLIGKPFTEGGQPYVNYILYPQVFSWLKRIGFEIAFYKSSEIIMPARVPKHFWNENTPFLLKPFGYRTFYILNKR